MILPLFYLVVMVILLLAHQAEELGVLEICVCVGVLVHGMCAYVCVWVWMWVCPFIWVITSCPVRDDVVMGKTWMPSLVPPR